MVRVHSGLPFLVVLRSAPAKTSPVIRDAKSMTVDEAKELLIDRMNYMAYRETDHSLWDSDKNRLFGAEHYVSGRPVLQPSVWGDGEELSERWRSCSDGLSCYLRRPTGTKKRYNSQKGRPLSESHHQLGWFLMCAQSLAISLQPEWEDKVLRRQKVLLLRFVVLWIFISAA